MNQTSLTSLGKIVLATAYLVMVAPISSVYASGLPTTENSHSPQLLLADDNDDDDDDDDNKQVQVVPESVKTAVLEDISRRTNVEISALRVVKAQKQTWADGCLGLKGNECTQNVVPGWQVFVADKQKMWVYRTDESGKVAMLDEGLTQAVSATMLRTQTTTSQVTSRTTVQRQVMTVQRTTQARASAVAYDSKKPGFTLAILQPSGNFTEVIARVSVKAKRGKGYFKERFLGDYKYKIKHKAKFVKGLKAGDRIVVRLFDPQNRFIGYSEFDCLTANTAVNLILSANPTQYQVVRTVYGVDADFDGKIDAGTTTYDYFTQVSGQRVSFFSNSRQIRASQFQVQGLSTITATSVYPASFTKESISAFSSSLAPALKAAPGKLVPLNQNDDSNSTYDITELMKNYRQVGVANGVLVKFSDVSTNHWARDFIAELAAIEVIEGFPDGTFRPDQQVTRAQFAAMISQAFEKVKVRNAIKFKDVSSRYWAYNAIREAYQTGFLGTFGNEFKPTISLSRLEVMLGLARGLNYTTSSSTEAILANYTDADTIRSDVRQAIAALTNRGIVVNYPNAQSLNADKVATRAEVCALLYKALVSTGDVADISSPHTVEKTAVEAQEDDDDTQGRE
ncbi:S-layer homology domain-containing protein [Iningainema tapete]|uniref:S-layer homology domain-containing protein n=1 Tax=Iningainema tapete TaxID=2806730 RepID=UPI001EE1E866|nr:S-layer homology domain-containing protein [Iningainema tapete]